MRQELLTYVQSAFRQLVHVSSEGNGAFPFGCLNRKQKERPWTDVARSFAVTRGGSPTRLKQWLPPLAFISASPAMIFQFGLARLQALCHQAT